MQVPTAQEPVRLAPLRRLYLLFAGIGFGESALIPFFPLLLRERGLSPQEIGGVLAAMALVGFATGPLWGYAADRRLGRERALVASLGSTSAVLVALFLVTDPLATAVVATGAWALRAPNMALLDAIALERLGVDRRGLYGRIRAVLSAGWAAGALVWGALYQFAGLRPMTLVYAAVIGSVALVTGRVVRGRRALLPPAGTLRVGRGIVAAPALLAFLAALFLVNSSFNATWNFVTLRIDALGGGAFLIGAAACLQAAAEVPTMGATARVARRIGHVQLFAAGCLVFLSVFVAWALVSDPVVIASLRVVSGIGFALTYVGAVFVVDDLVPRRLRATGQAASKAVAQGLAPVAGSFGGGLIYGLAGPAAMFVVAACCAALAAAAVLVAAARRSGPPQPALE